MPTQSNKFITILVYSESTMASVASFAPTPAHGEAPGKDDSFAVLKALAEASAVILALTFVGGWSYLSSYYKTFGLNPLELDLSIPVVSTISVYVLYESVWPLFVFATIFVALVLAARRLHWLGRESIVAALGILLLTVAAAGLVHGRQVANQDMLEESRTLPYVSFATKQRLSGPSCLDSGTFGSLDCKLLLHYKSAYYFFQPVPKERAGSMNLYVLSESELAGVHVQRGLDRNGAAE
jgi:uncharacterized membrane protein YhaH (DUF805 family)